MYLIVITTLLLLYCSAFEQVVLPGIRRLINDSIIIIIIIKEKKYQHLGQREDKSHRYNDDDDICGVIPIRDFPAVRRVIGHLVPILGGRRLAGLVRGGGGACPSGNCQVGMTGQLVDPAPAQHGALGGRQTSAGYGPARKASVEPLEGRTRAWWPPSDTTSR